MCLQGLDARRLVEHGAAFLGPQGQRLVDQPLPDNDKGIARHAARAQQMDHVTQAGALAVDEKLVAAVTVDAAGNGYFGRRLGEQGIGQLNGAVTRFLRLSGFPLVVGLRPVESQRAIPAAAVVQRQADLSHAHLAAAVATREDQILALFAPQVAYIGFAQHPAQGVGDVALAGAIGSDDSGDAVLEEEFGTVGEALVALDFEPFEAHRQWVDRRPQQVVG